jgi:hypothetical protein
MSGRRSLIDPQRISIRTKPISTYGTTKLLHPFLCSNDCVVIFTVMLDAIKPGFRIDVHSCALFIDPCHKDRLFERSEIYSGNRGFHQDRFVFLGISSLPTPWLMCTSRVIVIYPMKELNPNNGGPNISLIKLHRFVALAALFI